MAITEDASGQGTNVGSPTDVSITLGTLTDGVLLVGVNLEGDSSLALTSVVLDPGGADEHSLTQLTIATEGGSFKNIAAIYYALDANLPGSGTYTVRVTFSGSSSLACIVHAQSYNGMSQTAPSGAQLDTDQGASITDLSLAPTVASADSLCFLSGSCGQTRTWTPPTSYTEKYDTTAGSASGSVATRIEPSTGALSLTWSASANSNRLVGVAAVWAEAGGGGGGGGGIRNPLNGPIVLRNPL